VITPSGFTSLPTGGVYSNKQSNNKQILRDELGHLITHLVQFVFSLVLLLLVKKSHQALIDIVPDYAVNSYL